MVTRDIAQESWIPQIRQLLSDVNDCENSTIQEQLCEEIFSVVAMNVAGIRKMERFAIVVRKKLKEWRYSSIPCEIRIFGKFRFLLDQLQIKNKKKYKN
jgi:hypothetical protein